MQEKKDPMIACIHVQQKLQTQTPHLFFWEWYDRMPVTTNPRQESLQEERYEDLLQTSVKEFRS